MLYPGISPLSLISLLPSAQHLYFFPAAFSGTSSAPAQNVHEMTIGSIVFRVAEGDITKEEADVIVNITNQTYSLKTGILVGIMYGWKSWIKEGKKYIFQCFKSFCFILWLLFCFLGYKGSVRECLKLFCLLIHVTGWHVFLQQGKPIILGFCFIKTFYRTSLGLTEKRSLNEILTSLKLVRYFRHHFE